MATPYYKRTRVYRERKFRRGRSVRNFIVWSLMTGLLVWGGQQAAAAVSLVTGSVTEAKLQGSASDIARLLELEAVLDGEPVTSCTTTARGIAEVPVYRAPLGMQGGCTYLGSDAAGKPFYVVTVSADFRRVVLDTRTGVFKFEAVS